MAASSGPLTLRNSPPMQRMLASAWEHAATRFMEWVIKRISARCVRILMASRQVDSASTKTLKSAGMSSLVLLR